MLERALSAYSQLSAAPEPSLSPGCVQLDRFYGRQKDDITALHQPRRTRSWPSRIQVALAQAGLPAAADSTSPSYGHLRGKLSRLTTVEVINLTLDPDDEEVSDLNVIGAAFR